MTKEDRETMEEHCYRMIATANHLIPADESTRVYWLLIKQASELWLEQNTKNKPLKRKAKR